MFIYYDSKTGNVQRFIDKLKKERPKWSFIKINETMEVENSGHLITFTTKFGEIPETTVEFLKKENNRNFIKSVSSSGNMNWGTLFGVAADKISREYNISILMKFELSGTQPQVEYFINYVENDN
ncbi:class Ib ribonucleoside-diphosphate reductase assembly flavoprotein NrdI [Leptotrichia sp. OH3620_COT-345]|uniref:class Ib ribonucleoside-diphosphate reductase assembly flavoprotein NrdI n=1 Tax=Leptotrichia sp. OH3620_COT-345 TaxID=2491048 RepID=UPI000F64E96B|nr:class Ib ribonucleoside-diphosphate reductase assembly flavoprotein NrdI [Leptotrichia sp. OH3620_COT-345]RRD39150.1 class Ib ribonucleoside-diphosphate reductase assembly flavoprotein NrdI [Leptotrichia sp. OH3620_COT-345]